MFYFNLKNLAVVLIYKTIPTSKSRILHLLLKIKAGGAMATALRRQFKVTRAVALAARRLLHFCELLLAFADKWNKAGGAQPGNGHSTGCPNDNFGNNEEPV